MWMFAIKFNWNPTGKGLYRVRHWQKNLKKRRWRDGNCEGKALKTFIKSYFKKLF
jgi:hypothetical protein